MWVIFGPAGDRVPFAEMLGALGRPISAVNTEQGHHIWLWDLSVEPAFGGGATDDSLR